MIFTTTLRNVTEQPHRHIALARILLRHPHWRITYDTRTGIYTAHRPLADRHRAMGLTIDTLASTDTSALAEAIAHADALRAGIDHLTAAPDIAACARELITRLEQYLADLSG